MLDIATIGLLLKGGLISAEFAKKLYDWSQGKGSGPLGSPGGFEEQNFDSPQDADFKSQLNPILHSLLLQRAKQLQEPQQEQQSPGQEFINSPLAPLMGAMAPQFLMDMSGDPEAGASEWLTPLLSALAYQGAPQLGKWLESQYSPQDGPVDQPISEPAPEPQPDQGQIDLATQGQSQYPGAEPDLVEIMQNLGTKYNRDNLTPEQWQQAQELTNKHGIAENRLSPKAKMNKERARLGLPPLGETNPFGSPVRY